MVNVYVFRSDSSTPSGWSEIGSGYRDRLCLCNGALETGGADNHNHGISGWGCTGSDNNRTDAGGINTQIAAASHTHVQGAAPIIGTASHLPPYKNFRLVYRSTIGWNGLVPSGAIVFRENVPTFGGSRTESGSSSFIRISGTAGGTGGSSSPHNHSVSGTTGPNSQSMSKSIGTPDDVCWGKLSHTHDYSGTSENASAPDYYYWACGLIQASANTFIQANSYLLFDGTPDSKWEVTTAANNHYLRISSTNSIITGGSYLAYNHTHTFSFYSYMNAWDYIVDGSGNASDGRHGHTISFTLAGDANLYPSFVKLTLARALYNFGGLSAQIFML